MCFLSWVLLLACILDQLDHADSLANRLQTPFLSRGTTSSRDLPVRMQETKVHETKAHASYGDAYTAMMVVPTGIGAAIGGFAGDALPAARLLSEVVDTLITHPNVMNGAMLYWPRDNVLYVEGYALDEFAAGTVGLRPCKKRAQRIGLLLDRGMNDNMCLRQMQVADAARATLGLDVAAAVKTSRAVGVSTAVSASGASWGKVEDTSTLVEGARRLVNEHGCTAVAVVAAFPDEDEDEGGAELFEAYRRGEGVDAIAGVEALISRAIVKELGVPCAHAPAFEEAPGAEPFAGTTPKAAAEELGHTFLPCVLANLHRAPALVPLGGSSGLGFPGTVQANADCLRAEHVDAVVVPVDAMGGPAVLSFMSRDCSSSGGTPPLVIAVQENESAMRVTADALQRQQGQGLGQGQGKEKYPGVVVARSYAEAAGILAAHRAGILHVATGAVVPPLQLLD